MGDETKNVDFDLEAKTDLRDDLESIDTKKSKKSKEGQINDLRHEQIERRKALMPFFLSKRHYQPVNGEWKPEAVFGIAHGTENLTEEFEDTPWVPPTTDIAEIYRRRNIFR